MQFHYRDYHVQRNRYLHKYHSVPLYVCAYIWMYSNTQIFTHIHHSIVDIQIYKSYIQRINIYSTSISISTLVSPHLCQNKHKIICMQIPYPIHIFNTVFFKQVCSYLYKYPPLHSYTRHCTQPHFCWPGTLLRTLAVSLFPLTSLSIFLLHISLAI